MKIIRFLVLSFGILLFLVSFIPVIHAESGQTYIVDASSVNVRSAPSHNSDIVGQLANGDQVAVFQEEFGWAQTYYDGKEGWVASQFLVPVEDGAQTQATASSETVTVTSPDVRIRTGPGTDYNIVGYTSEDDTYTLLEAANSWYKVALDDDKTGWIAAWLTSTETDQAASATVNTEGDDTKVISDRANGNGSLSGYTIVIDPGHGGKDPGSIGLDGSFEKDHTMSTASHVTQKLRDAGATVILTRSGDEFVSLENRVNTSESHNTSAFISLHYNAYPVMGIGGFSTHYYTNGNDRVLAEAIQSALGRNISLNSRGAMNSDYHVLRENRSLAVLVELGFITNPYDLATIQTEDYQNAVADGITEGLMDYFN